MAEEPKKKSKEELLEEFSELLIKLGKEIEAKLTEKEKLEAELKLKAGTIRKLESEVFSIRTQLAKIATELSKLESRRKEFEKQKLLLEKK